mgnify:FL=1|tara:strand:+ start:519 stop:845 length:327 start_codon:yes stop_codon:yes gene_type:complete
MSWEVSQEYKDLILPSLDAYVMEKAEERGCLCRVVAMELLIESRVGMDSFDEEAIRKEFKDVDWWCLLPLIAERVTSMTNGGWEFNIDEAGWTTVPVCSNDHMLEYYS